MKEAQPQQTSAERRKIHELEDQVREKDVDIKTAIRGREELHVKMTAELSRMTGELKKANDKYTALCVELTERKFSI